MILHQSTIAAHRIYVGFAATNVRDIRVFAGDRQLASATLTDPWTPAAPGAQPLRFWVAVDETDIDVGGDGVQMDERDLLPVAPPRIEATTSAGKVIKVRSPWTQEPGVPSRAVPRQGPATPQCP